MRNGAKKDTPSTPSSRRTSQTTPSSDDADDDDLPPTTKTPASSPYSYPNYDDDEEDEEDDEDDGNLLEIVIETLTGTTFQVRVSPWETGAGLKGLLQRTQGLAANDQHILIGQTELSDEAPLIDQGVQDGSCLRLVLAMKGGPMNSRRISTYDDALWKEFSDYMDVNREELWENEPGRPVTLLVLREGDAVNLYRVVENDDGTFSPLNESWGSSGSGRSGSSCGKDSLLEETVKHQQKMADLSSKMEALKTKNIERKKKKRVSSKPSSPKVTVASNRARRSRVAPTRHPRKEFLVQESTNAKTKAPSTKSAGKKNTQKHHIHPSRLPPVQPSPSRRTRPAAPSRSHSRQMTDENISESRRHSLSRGSRILDELPKRTQPKHVEFSYHPKLDSIRPQKERRGSLHTLKEDSNSPTSKSKYSSKQYNAYRESLVRHGKTGPSEQENSSRMEEEDKLREAWSGRDVPFPLYIDQGTRRRPKFKPRLNQSYNIGSLQPPKDLGDDRPKTSPEVLEGCKRPGSTTTSSTMSDRITLRGPDDKLKELITILNSTRANSRYSERSNINKFPPLGAVGPLPQDLGRVQAHQTPSRGLQHRSGRNSLSMSLASLGRSSSSSPPALPSTSDMGLEAFLNSNSESQSQLDILKDMVKNSIASTTSRISTPSEGGRGKVFRRPGSGQFKAAATVPPRGIVPPTPSKRKNKTNKLRARCQECNKKIGVVTSYSCRCGHVFCAQHRYSETHSCTYDYKSAGKKLIEMTNPLVVPPKLPKI